MDNNEKVELNYELLYKMAMKKLEDDSKIMDEYFQLLVKAQNISSYPTVAGEHMYEMSMADQVILLKATIAMGEAAKVLCDKYGFEVEDEDEE